MSLTEPIKTVIVHVGRQTGKQDRLGDLESWREADLTILDANPYEVDLDKIMDIKVSETWVGGKRLHG